MTLLTTVQRFCKRTGLPSPATVYGTTDTQIGQILGLLEEEGGDLALRHPWQALTFEATHTTLAAEDQGAMTSIATNGFNRVKNETMWDRTNDLPVYGPMDSKDWQRTKALTLSASPHRYRIRGGKLIVTPTPSAGDSWAFEYLSDNWILAVDGTTYKQYFTADTDTMLLPEKILLAGLRWRWKKEKGFDYAEDFRTYESMVQEAKVSDGSKPTLQMDDRCEGARPGFGIKTYGTVP